MNNQLSIAFSPCPNDTFIFDSLIHKPNISQHTIQAHLYDVEALNQLAFKQSFHITKLSFHALLHLQNNYELLNAGAALGNGCGPLIISKKHIDFKHLNSIRIAIPGNYTTANFLLHAFVNQPLKVVPMVFSNIENAILSNEVDAGVIIHENRFTYQQKGLIKLQDLGQWWQQETQLPIPLGCIAIHKSKMHLKTEIENQIVNSIEKSWNNWPLLSNYVINNAQEMDHEVIKQHIELYVNNYTISLGEAGIQAYFTMQKYFEKIKQLF